MIYGATIPKTFQALHASNRVALGPRPGDLDAINRVGVERWIEQQLHPEAIAESAELERQIATLTTLRMTPIELFE